MKKYIILPIAAAAVACLTACSADDVAGQRTEGLTPIRLTASVAGEGTTRGYTAANLRNNTRVYVWADMINLSDSRRTDYFKGWELKATSTPGELTSATAGDVKFFPATNVLDMYAMSGTFSGYTINSQNSLPVSPAFIYHTVSTDQTTESAYYGSDLLYAQVRNQEPVSAATGVELKFYHMLSKVRVVLIPGNGNTVDNPYTIDQLRTATVTLLGVQTRAKFTPARNVSTDDFAEQATRAAMVATAPKTADDATDYDPLADVTIGTGVAASAAAADDASFADAVIVPQTVSAGQFIKVTLTDPGTGLTHNTYYRFADDFTFESGKKYQFLLTLDRIGETYSLTPAVADWTDEAASRPVDMKQPTE